MLSIVILTGFGKAGEIAEKAFKPLLTAVLTRFICCGNCPAGRARARALSVSSGERVGRGKNGEI
jgi:hypothetical protein